MQLSAMFLRADCILPDAMELVQTRFDETWMSIENAPAGSRRNRWPSLS